MSSPVIPPPQAPGAMHLDDSARPVRAECAFTELVRDACAAARVPAVVSLVRRRLERPNPGRMYSSLAHKQA